MPSSRADLVALVALVLPACIWACDNLGPSEDFRAWALRQVASHETQWKP